MTKRLAVIKDLTLIFRDTFLSPNRTLPDLKNYCWPQNTSTLGSWVSAECWTTPLSQWEAELITCRLSPKVVAGRAYADSDSGLLWLG